MWGGIVSVYPLPTTLDLTLPALYEIHPHVFAPYAPTGIMVRHGSVRELT